MCLDRDLAAQWLGMTLTMLEEIEGKEDDLSPAVARFIVGECQNVVLGALRRSAGGPPGGKPRLVVDNTLVDWLTEGDSE
jgi:hypothetical protein